MQSIGSDIFYEDSYAGVTLGAIIRPRGSLLIDAPLRAEDSRTWNATLLKTSSQYLQGNHEAGCSEHVLVYLDAHPDRTIGARVLENAGQIPTIIAHQEAAHGFDNRPTIFKGQITDTGAEWEVCEDVISTRWALPDLTFTRQMRLFWEQQGEKKSSAASQEVLLEHHPGPAAGSIWVIIPLEKALFIGDTVVVNQPPFLESAHIPRWLNALEELLSSKYEGYTIISGRGAKVTTREIRNQLTVLKRIHLLLESLAQRGAPSEATEDIVPDLLSKYDFADDRWPLYSQRLKYGLQCYYARNYFPSEELFIE